MNRKFISLITILMLVLSVPCVSYAVSEEPVDVTENTTIVDVSGMEEGQAASDELLVLVDEGTSKRKVSGIANDAGASLDNISTLGDGTKLAKVTIDGENEAQTVAEEIAADDAVLIVQPNYIYQLNEASDASEDMSLEASENEAASDSAKVDINNNDDASTDPTMSDENDPSSIEGNEDEGGSDVVTSTEITEEDVTATTSTVKVTNPLDGDSDTYIDQWYLGSSYSGSVKAEAAWRKLSTQGSKVTVAVIDTGVKLDHTDLKNNIIKEKCVTFNYGKKGTFTQWDGADDEDGHGTHVCGLIAASANDGYGIKGVANDRAKLFVVDANVADLPKGGFTTQDMVLGINYAVDNGADIINLSVGGLGKDYLDEKAVQDANAKNVLVVCAAGNESTNISQTPGDTNEAISVMAHNSNGAFASFSNFGVYKDVSAPGVNILSTYIGDESGVDYYRYIRGTSMASPIVAGIAALIKSENKNLNTREIKNYIYTSGGTADFNDKAGFGKVNALSAIENVNKTTVTPSSIVLNSMSLSLCPGEEFSLEYAVFPGAASKHADEVIFSTSDPDVAIVDENGKVTAVGPGGAMIFALWGDNIRQSCAVTVSDIEYESLSYPGSEETAPEYEMDYSSFHKLKAVRMRNGNAVAFEGLVKGFKINVTDINDYVTLTSRVGNFISVFRVYDPDGNEVPLTQRNYFRNNAYECTAGMSPKKTGEYKIQLLLAWSGSYSSVNFVVYSSKYNDIGKADVSGVTNRAYTGSAQTQNPVVKFKGATLENGTDYTLTYSNNVNAGTATMTVTGIGEYKGSQDVTFNINKAGNGLSVSGKTYKIKRSKVKKKAKTVAASSVMTVRGANGALRYAKVSGSKKLSINAYNGAVTIKKKTKKGTYKMKVNVTALGDANHYGSKRQVTIKVKVK